jgi:inorganic triphosphatase YgiF
MDAHSQRRPTELEIKFHLSSGSDEALEAHPMLRSDRQPEHEVTTYFDTPAGDLLRQAFSLRVRAIGTQRVQTLKLRGDQAGPFARGEWEWPVGSDRPDLDLLADTPAASLLQAKELEPVFTTDVQRSVRTVQQDGATIEVAVDRGRVIAGGTAEEIRELELELKAGDPEPMYRLAATLHTSLAMSLSAESKADRGWRLRTGRPRSAVKQASIDLPEDVTAAAAFRMIVDGVLAHFMANQPAAASGDIEGVHQMRVAVRRLRAALLLFRPHLEPHAQGRFTEALRSLGRVFGEARDWDVFCTEVLPGAAENGISAPWLDLLRGPAEDRRIKAHASAAAELGAPLLTATVLGLAGWAGDTAVVAGQSNGGAMHRPLADLAPGLIARLERKVLHRGRHIGRLGDAELHALRKSLKKLRYGLEFVQPLYRHKQVKAYLHACKGLLNRLGEFNDAVVAVELAAGLGGQRQPELAPAVAALAGWSAAHQSKARRRLRKDWDNFRGSCLPG